MVIPSKQLGNTGEDLACHFLQGKKFRILARNWRYQHVELDIVARHGDTLVFVEVKTRSAGGLSTAVEAITPRKKACCIKAARAWLTTHNAWDEPCRFDIVCVVLLPTASGAAHNTPVFFWNGATFSVEHYCHAFDVSPTLDCSNTAWQPW